eukprot:1631143-Rhodomonas_salina.3
MPATAVLAQSVMERWRNAIDGEVYRGAAEGRRAQLAAVDPGRSTRNVSLGHLYSGRGQRYVRGRMLMSHDISRFQGITDVSTRPFVWDDDTCNRSPHTFAPSARR